MLHGYNPDGAITRIGRRAAWCRDDKQNEIRDLGRNHDLQLTFAGAARGDDTCGWTTWRQWIAFDQGVELSNFDRSITRLNRTSLLSEELGSICPLGGLATGRLPRFREAPSSVSRLTPEWPCKLISECTRFCPSFAFGPPLDGHRYSGMAFHETHIC